jgi:regulator of ribonuclease activity A
MMISTPDLYDEHGESLQIAEPGWQHYGGKKAFGGKVVTVKADDDNTKVGELLKSAGEGCVLVVDAGASKKHAFLGDNLAQAGIDNGWQGVIVNGCVRDVDLLLEMPIGVMALGAVPRKTEKRGLGDVNVALNFAGITVEPGDYVYGDLSGIVVSKEKLL